MRHAVPRMLLALLLGAAAVAGCSGDDEPADEPVGAGDFEPEILPLGEADEGIDGVQAFRIPPYQHYEGPIDYPVTPSPGSDHGPGAVSCEFHTEPVPEPLAVHTMEHGGVWLAYAPDLPSAEVDVLREVVDEYDLVVASPYPGLEAGEAVVATAWARQLRLGDVDDPRLVEFVEQYQAGSQAPESGIGC